MATPIDYARARARAQAEAQSDDSGGDAGGSSGSSSGSSGGGGGGFDPRAYARARAQAEQDQADDDEADSTTDTSGGGSSGGAAMPPSVEERESGAEQADEGDGGGGSGDRDPRDTGNGGGAAMPPSVEERERAAEQAADPRDELVDRDFGGGTPTPPTVEERERGAEIAQERRFSEAGIAGVPGQQDRISAAGAAVSPTPSNIARVRGQVEQAISETERSLSEQAGTDLEFGEDFRVDEGGGIEFTEEGERAIRGDEFEREVMLPSRVEGGNLFTAMASGGAVEYEAGEVTERQQLEDVTRGTAQEIRSTWIDAFDTPTDLGREPSALTPYFEGATEEGVATVLSAPVDVVTAIEEGREFGAEAVDVGLDEGLGAGIESVETEPEPVRVGPGPPRRRAGREVRFAQDEGAAPFIAEETGEFAGQRIEGLRQQLSTPRGQGSLAGSLVVSGAVMGGAAAVSSRAGLATRAAIQPGEELLGYGGFGVTRRVAGARTAQRLFPNREPLIFSEEAAISGARRGVRSARRGINRLQTELRRTDINVRPRPGIGGGGFAIEVERQERVEQPDELGPELDPFDVSDTRVYDPSRTFGESEPVERFIDEPGGEVPQDIGPGIGPRGEAGGFRGGSVEENFRAFMEEQRARSAAAQESFLETEARRRAETADVLSGQEVSGVDVEPRVMERLGFDVDQRSGTEPFTELDAETEQRGDVETEFGTEFEFEFETEQELGREFGREFEFETETEPESDIEAEVFGEGDREPSSGPEFGFESDSDESLIGDATGPGWLNVWAVALAGGGLEARRAADDGQRGVLPALTAGQADPDEDLRAGLEAVDEFFFRGGGDTGGGDSDSDSDEGDIFQRFL